MTITQWLDSKLDARKNVLSFVEDAEEFSMLAGALRAEAEAAGYGAGALVEACGGDICDYLMTAQKNSSPAIAA